MTDHIKNIFDEFKKLKVPDEIFRQLVLNTKDKSCYHALDDSIKENKEFIIKCLEGNIIPIDYIPIKLINTEVISKELYIKNIKKYANGQQTLYELTDEEVTDILKVNMFCYSYFEKRIENNVEIVKPALFEHFGLMMNLSDSIKTKILEDKDFKYKLLKQDYRLYEDLSEDDKNNINILKIVLKHKNGIIPVKYRLKLIKDDELALIALESSPAARNYLHPYYQEILIKNDVKENFYSFLKIYLMQKELEQEIPSKENNDIEASKKLKL